VSGFCIVCGGLGGAVGLYGCNGRTRAFIKIPGI
jgi:hypothetical protein